MKNISLWKAISDQSIQYPKLKEHIEVDVAIIGAGITGLTTALQLIEAGKKVAVLESNQVGSSTTGFSTGNLYVLVQPYFQNIKKKFDEETAKIIAHSRKFAIDYIEKTVQTKKIDCHFTRRPSFLYSADEEKISFLEKEVELLKKLDIPINFTNTLPLPFKFKKAAVMENQARFNPLEYVIGLAKYLHKKGCHIYEDTHVNGIEEKKTICVLKTAEAKVSAKKIVIATHTPIGINRVQFFTAPYRSYVVAARLKDKSYPEGHFWGLEEPHYVSSTHSIRASHPELLLVAGDHHKTGQGINMVKHYADIEKFLHKNFSVSEIVYRWSAQHYQAADNIPYIGFANRSTKNVYMATGFFADGLVYGSLAGYILADSILNKKSSLPNPCNANRIKPIASASFLIKEGTNVFIQYLKDFSFILDKQYDDIKRGEGKIVEIDKKKWAVSRDEKNKLHIVSAVCTHMKCIVNWNNAEKTWDCPCHGSRFTQEGKIIEGPALSHLNKRGAI